MVTCSAVHTLDPAGGFGDIGDGSWKGLKETRALSTAPMERTPQGRNGNAVNDTITSKGPTRTLLTPTASSVLVPETDLADRSAIARRLGSVLSVLFVVSSFLSFVL